MTRDDYYFCLRVNESLCARNLFITNIIPNKIPAKDKVAILNVKATAVVMPVEA